MKWNWNETWYRTIAENIAWIKESLEKLFQTWWIEELPFWKDTRNTIATILSLWIDQFCEQIWIKETEIIDYQLWWMAELREKVKVVNKENEWDENDDAE